jgi:hypothetical protein
MTTKLKQLNPFELKTSITGLLNKINSPEDLTKSLEDFELLDFQEDKQVISKILFKELIKSKPEKISTICFLLERYTPKEDFVNKLWEALKNQNLETEVRITILNLLRDLDADWSYETCEEFLEDGTTLLHEETAHLLNSAIINPEVQIDFMDFLTSIRTQDKLVLIGSIEQEFDSDALANILIPVFESEPNSPVGFEALRILGETKSQLVLPLLERLLPLSSGELAQKIKKSLSTLKISGIREDNTKEFYKKILANSKPDKFYITYPDGHGDVAMIFTRLTENNKIRLVSIVINVMSGVKDCFGFFEISQFECDKILERFLHNEKTVSINPESFKTILYNAEILTIKANQNNWKFPYEYVCWKNLLIDIDFDEEPLENILQEQLISKDVDTSIIEKLSKLKVSSHWFLDANYSDEFSAFLEKLKNSKNIDELIDNELDNVFNDYEKKEWIKKIILTSYIKFTIGKDDEAQEIFGLSKNDKVLQKLFRDILKRSIYEYLTLIKFDKDVDCHGLSAQEIDEKLKYIDEKWVTNV